MTAHHDPASRGTAASLADISPRNHAGTSATGNDLQRAGSLTLVAYFSRSGNTRVVAGLIHRSLGTDLFEIRPASPYPDDYLATVEHAMQERDSGHEPALGSGIPNMAVYDTVFLGFPVWGETVPSVIRSFLSTHDLSGKILIPFVTHGGYGIGDSLSVLAKYAPQARLLDGFVMEAEQERRTMNRVTDWLEGNPGYRTI